LARKVRAHCRGPEARLRRVSDQHVGGPPLKLRSSNDLTGVFLQVIELPDWLTGGVNATAQYSHYKERNYHSRLHARLTAQRSASGAPGIWAMIISKAHPGVACRWLVRPRVHTLESNTQS